MGVAPLRLKLEEPEVVGAGAVIEMVNALPLTEE